MANVKLQVLSRYWKKATQYLLLRVTVKKRRSLDEVQIKEIEDSYHYVKSLEQRKEEVLRLIEEQGKLNDQLKADIERATVLQRIEDLYRPYKQKRRTKAMIAIESGLEPLADEMMQQTNSSIEKSAAVYVNTEKEVHTIEDALEGAKFIIAERVSEDATMRERIRKTTWSAGRLTAALKKGAEDERKVFENYYDYEEPLNKIVPHRVLAINRGEKEDVLRVGVGFPADRIVGDLERAYLKQTGSPSASYIKNALEDSFKRLIAPSIEREVRTALTEKAEAQAIHVFSENLRSLLLQAPLKGRTVLGVDPAFRTGCKLAVVDEAGKLHDISVIYPHPPKPQKEASKK